MRITKAIFTKQAKDLLKNPMVLVMFIIFPAVAFIMTMLIDMEGFLNNNLFVTMMAAIFAGMGLITASAEAIAEDTERKSLRFLVLAGVKPHQYLLGVGGFEHDTLPVSVRHFQPDFFGIPDNGDLIRR